MPFAVKDNIDVKGHATTAACKAFTYQPQCSAAVVQALIDAGKTLPSCFLRASLFAQTTLRALNPKGSLFNRPQPPSAPTGLQSQAVHVYCYWTGQRNPDREVNEGALSMASDSTAA